MKKLLLSALAVMAMSCAWGADYGLPANIQDGNILHCFNWSAKDIKAELPNIAAAGFGTVQMSPLQRPDVKASGTSWHDLYRPYDLAFKSSGFCSEEDLKSLCDEAAKYGIKIIVDVVANHVDKTAGYHDTWWDGSGRVRWEGGINYGNRYSITHGQLGDYGDVNSESQEVINRAKAYVEKLKSLGVKGCRWDAAKHIGLPSEGCNFWSTVCSVSGMWHYGEILDNPGPDASIIKEYAKYMSVTDNQYCNYAARSNGGLPTGYGGDWAVNYNLGNKCVYWAESHDTYSNDEWSQNVSQDVIDRAYACYATRSDATCLYLARPNTKGFGNIKTGKGSTAFKNKHIAEVNKFRNIMVGKADYFTNNGNAVSITRKDGGAVIVMKNSGNVSIANGGGYCPAGTYTDRVSGGTFTVTNSTITGNVGSSGIAVIYKDGLSPEPNPNPNPDPDPNPTPDPNPGNADMWILGNLATGGWGSTPGTGFRMTASGNKYIANGVEFKTASGETLCYLNITDYLGSDWDDLNMNANRYGSSVEGEQLSLGTPSTVVKYANNVNASGCLSWTIPAGKYDFVFDPSAMTLTVTNHSNNPTPNPDPTPDPNPGNGVSVYVDGWNNVYCYVYADGNGEAAAWPGIAMSRDAATGYWKYDVPDSFAQNGLVIINTNTGSDRYPADMEPGMPLNGKSMIFHVSDHSWVEYNANPNPNPNPNPDPTPGDADMWILGNLATGGWGLTPGTGYRMSQIGNTYIANGVEFQTASGESLCYLNITDYLGSDWDDLNMGANRYGSSLEGEQLVLGTPSTVVKYANNINASGCLSWTIPAGKYDFVFDASAMTLTAKTHTEVAIDYVEADYQAEPVYYNLQGIRVENPVSGLYIRVTGSRTEKVRL